MEKYFDINESGFSVRCKLYCSNVHDIRRAVIFGHGFGGHKDNKAAEKFAGKLISKHKDMCVVTFNWPCHGDDARKNLLLSECDTYLTLVIEYVKRVFGAKEIYAYATSFGGFLFLKYIAEHGNPFKKIALRCPAITLYDSMIHRIMSQDDLDKILKGKPALVGFDRKIKISKPFLDDLAAAAVADVECDGGGDKREAEETDVVWMLLHGRWIRAGPRFFPPGMAVIVSHSGSADKHVI